MINSYSLDQVPIEGNCFTWCKSSTSGRMEQHLDRGLCNMLFYEQWLITKSLICPRTCSDHSAIVI